MYGSVDEVVDGILRQVPKHKERLLNHMPRRGRMRTCGQPLALSARETKITRPALHTLSTEDAVRLLDIQPSGGLVHAKPGRVGVMHGPHNGIPEIIDPQPV